MISRRPVNARIILALNIHSPRPNFYAVSWFSRTTSRAPTSVSRSPNTWPPAPDRTQQQQYQQTNLPPRLPPRCDGWDKQPLGPPCAGDIRFQPQSTSAGFVHDTSSRKAVVRFRRSRLGLGFRQQRGSARTYTVTRVMVSTSCQAKKIFNGETMITNTYSTCMYLEYVAACLTFPNPRKKKKTSLQG